MVRGIKIAAFLTAVLAIVLACGCSSDVSVNRDDAVVTEVTSEDTVISGEAEEVSGDTEQESFAEDGAEVSAENEETVSAEITEEVTEDSATKSEEFYGNGAFGWGHETENYVYCYKFGAESFDDGGFFGRIDTKEYGLGAIVAVDKSNGEETEIIPFAEAGGFAVADDSIYYNVDGWIFCADTDGKNIEKLVKGKIFDITEDGKYIVYGNGEALYTVNTESGKSAEICDNAVFLDVYRNVIYYSLNEYSMETKCGKVTLFCSNGEDNRLLCVTASDLYTETSSAGASAANIAHIHFDDEYVYFSYGSVAGSASVYQGGGISRVRYDGSGYEVLVNGEGYTEGEFYVENGKAVVITEANADASFKYLTKYYQDDETVYLFSEPSGKPVEIIRKEEYRTAPVDGYNLTDYVSCVSLTDNYIIFAYSTCEINPEKNVGWRDYFDRVSTSFMIVERDGGEIVFDNRF